MRTQGKGHARPDSLNFTQTEQPLQFG